MLKSQLIQVVLYALFAGTFFAVRRGGERKEIVRRAAKYAGLMAGLALLFGWIMLILP